MVIDANHTVFVAVAIESYAVAVLDRHGRARIIPPNFTTEGVDIADLAANATYEDKSSLLTKMGSGNIVYKTLDVTEQRVIDLGDTALLVSRLTASVTVGGAPRAIDNWTLSVWTREEGEWRLIAYQPTGIPK